MTYIKKYKKDISSKRKLQLAYRILIKDFTEQLFGEEIKLKKVNLFSFKIKIPSLSYNSNLYNFTIKADCFHRYNVDFKPSNFEITKYFFNETNYSVSLEEKNISINSSISEKAFIKIKKNITHYKNYFEERKDELSEIIKAWHEIEKNQFEYYPQYWIEKNSGVEFEKWVDYINTQKLFGWVPMSYAYAPHFHNLKIRQKNVNEPINAYLPLIKIHDNEVYIRHLSGEKIIKEESFNLKDFFSLSHEDCFIYTSYIMRLLPFDILNMYQISFNKHKDTGNIVIREGFLKHYRLIRHYVIKNVRDIIRQDLSINGVLDSIRIRDKTFEEVKKYPVIEKMFNNLKFSEYPIPRLKTIDFRKMTANELYAYTDHNFFFIDLIEYIEKFHPEFEIGKVWKQIDLTIEGIKLNEPTLGKLVREKINALK